MPNTIFDVPNAAGVSDAELAELAATCARWEYENADSTFTFSIDRKRWVGVVRMDFVDALHVGCLQAGVKYSHFRFGVSKACCLDVIKNGAFVCDHAALSKHTWGVAMLAAIESLEAHPLKDVLLATRARKHAAELLEALA